ncbi:hypothetical protein [Flagellimonas sp.]|uniref:hypothetical protein n=1 Tax=Flagellimonas sp. TaxID=2058762 RepID=UPI003BAC1A59
MEINDRLKIFVSHLGLSERQFTYKCGLSEGALRPGRSLNGTGLAKVKKTYPEINIYWVLLGDGQMILDSDLIKEESGVHKTSLTIDHLLEQKINEIIDDRIGNIKELIKELIVSEMEAELEAAKNDLKKDKNGTPT